jgi:CDP-diacylglycerol--glycerol-3-phosphate 3-phosphatidyltransferase
LSIFAHWPNRITAIRFVGALMLFALFAVYGEEPVERIRLELKLAFGLFLLVAATDVLDGYLARKYGLVSAFGRVADPFVDKVLVVGTLVYMAVMPWSKPVVPASAVVVVLAREFLVTGLRGYVESVGREFPADRFGKLKMILQCIAIEVVLFSAMIAWPDAWGRGLRMVALVLVWVMVAVTLGSGIGYVHKTRRILAGGS